MEDRLLFLIGPPRSGSTMLARMLGAHSAIHSPAEPHLITPLAHLGFHARVDEAPYDPIITQTAAREMVRDLPNGERDYLDAIRACTDTLYERLLSASGRRWLLDKTPAYALVLDFLARLYPKAHYVVLTRHPMAVWTSYVDSFFDGDAAFAHEHNPLLERYVPAIARFLRDAPVSFCPVRYEELVQDPETHLQRICAHVGLAYEPGMVTYGEQEGGTARTARGLGDPMTASREKRPTTASLERWVRDLAGRPDDVALCEKILAELSDDDLAEWGHSRSDIATQLASVPETGGRRRSRKLTRYLLERRILRTARKTVRRSGALRRGVQRIRWACDILLR
ncbi:MAG: sulfotransferase family protein [Myxococcota bacterium]